MVSGAGGMLGQDLVSALELAGEAVVGLARNDLDITDEVAMSRVLQAHRPDIVVNCAGWTAVDDAEEHEDEALLVNGVGVGQLAKGCAAAGARLVHISTDYVFGGDAGQPYSEHAAPGPRTAYGRTKLVGDQAVLRLLPETGYVVRTAWLYGAHGPNFVRTMIRLEREQPTVDVVDDQRGQPTWTVDVARQIVGLVNSPAGAGIYHVTSSGETTWFEFAREIYRLLGADPARVRATTSSAYPRPAARPTYSVLGRDAWVKTGIEPIGHWRRALRKAFPVLLAG
ncbi:MAG TPA: dTDP-4-dehydrorhamnose reductase [Streptosporangiaceae bacterium]|nr:dTDP-4-dehydrorhamnose reductase [Streptosporangiaceae bacterium]